MPLLYMKAFLTKVQLPMVLCALNQLNLPVKIGNCDNHHLLIELVIFQRGGGGPDPLVCRSLAFLKMYGFYRQREV